MAQVFTIPPSVPFLPTLAEALLDGSLVPGFAPRGDPLSLARATVFLPTRRAAQAFSIALLDALGREATLLPRIAMLGDLDDDASAFEHGVTVLPPACSLLERRLVLARLVRAFAESAEREGEPLVGTTPAVALALSAELARLFDDLTTANVSFAALDEGHVPPALDVYWQQSFQFLKLAYDGWTKHLDDVRRLDPVVRRDRLLAEESARLAAAAGGPYIVAGSTGTIPASAALIAAIANRPDGAVVLPGLDQALDDGSFDCIESERGEPAYGHPQFGMKRLLRRLAIGREDVKVLGAGNRARERLLSAAFLPAAATERWHGTAEAALAGFTVIEAADPREEALALALVLREALESPDKTAALITPDRALARRVASELKRWNLDVDDSAGIALADTLAGRLARLAAAAAAEGLAPVSLLALLRHPLASLGVQARAVDALEIAVLRGPRPAAGGQGLLHAVRQAYANRTELHRREAAAALSETDWGAALDAAERTVAALEPLLSLADKGTTTLATLVQAQRKVLEHFGSRGAVAGNDPHGIAALAEFLDELEGIGGSVALSLPEYADALASLMAGAPPIRPPFDPIARLRILGPLEARLLHVDLALLGGLNDGTWPPLPQSDAWLNRPLRRALGLDLPERRIGLSAHDFVQAAGAREVVCSRAKKSDGVETLASRFLQRIKAASTESAWKAAVARGETLLAIARQWEKPAAPAPIERPTPRPPVDVRPSRFSVTDIETLIRDPYSIYARDILHLAPLDPLDADPGAAERGTILHEALADFLRTNPDRLPDDPLAQLLECGKRAFARIEDFPGIRAVWWPRFERVARWFVALERTRRKDLARSLSETRGAIEWVYRDRTFRLTARADRIDLRMDRSIAIIDYKTGEPPGLNEALSGLAPQLPLEAAIARGGGFPDVERNTRVFEIAVVRLSGGSPPGEVRVLDPARATDRARANAVRRGIDSPDRLADVSRELLQTLLAKFDDPNTPYHSVPRPKWRGRFGRYDHLARIKEWSAGEETDEW